jgi:hypothetical protein
MNVVLERFRELSITLTVAENLLSLSDTAVSLNPKTPLEFASLLTSA